MHRATNTLLKKETVIPAQAQDLGIGRIVPPVKKVLSAKEETCVALATD